MAFGGEFNSASNQPMAEINMTPLVDVMLVLLIIFIVTAPLMTQAIKVDLPQASAKALEQKPENIRLVVKADNKIYWNEEEISENDLTLRLEAAAARTPQPEVHLSADRDTLYEKIAQVMSSTQEAGIAKFGFVTQNRRSKN